MKNFIILDTGPLVAYINQKDKYHGWAKKRFQEIVPPVLTCQPVISEACFLMRHIDCGREIILEMIERNVIQTEFNLNVEAKALKQLICKYRDVPMSLADACLVRISKVMDSLMRKKNGRNGMVFESMLILNRLNSGAKMRALF